MSSLPRPSSTSRLFAPFALFGLAATLFAIYTTLELKHRQIDDSLAELGRTSVEALTVTMSKSLAPEIEALVVQTRNVTGLELANHPAVAVAHARLGDAVAGTNIAKIKIFDANRRTIYSPAAREIGVQSSHPSAVPDAMAGRSTTTVYPPRAVDGYGGMRHLDSVVATYAPVRNAGGAIAAVFEIYVDTSLERTNIEVSLRRFDATIVAILLALYATLLALGWRATRAQARQSDTLAAERARFADFSDIAAGWVWETDAEHRLTFTSLGIRAIGIEPGSRYGMRSRAWDEPTGVEREGPKLGEIMDAKREFRDVHIRLEVPDGREVWLARSGRPIFGADGAFLGYRGADRDVTQSVTAERELRTADATKGRLLDALDRARMGLELAVETSQMGWWEIDGSTGEQYWSPRAREIWGKPGDTPPADGNFAGAMHPDDAGNWADALVLPAGMLVRNYRIVRSDGEIRHVRQHTRVERNPSGSLLRVTGTVIDVTDTENLRADAERAKAVLDSALDAMRDGFVLFDADERLVTFNKAYVSLRPGIDKFALPGATAVEINDAAFELAFAPAADPAGRRELAKMRIDAFRNPGPALVMNYANGRIVEIVDTRTEAGYTVSITRDVTAERRAAAELARAKAAAEQASRAKSRFLATMSHEIRTPMNGVLGTIELLAGTPLDSRQRIYVETVDRSASALLSILDDILDYSKLEAGDLKVETIAFDPASVLRQTAALMAPGAEKKGLPLDCRIGADVPDAVAGDPTRVRQVLFNLIGNAIKFTQSGRIDTALEMRGDSLVFAVADTGIGIEPSALSRLFDRFSQADETIARRFGGTGLGLAIARDLARAMGGDIDVVSAPGQGSTFALRLPIRAAQAAATPALAAPKAALLPARSLDLLVAEDNEINRMVVQNLLERMGHRVTFANDGRAAIALARAKRHDAILMDAQMPEIDGVEATRWIRILPEPFGSVPIVALTANAMRGDREAYLAVGMTDYVAKPVNGAELARVLERVTGIAAQTQASRAAAPPAQAANEGLAALVANLRAGRNAQ
jgi:signal transduction histidine kinase/FixJ family two-component response regulator